MVDVIRLTGSGFYLETVDGEVLERLSYYNSTALALDVMEHVIGVAPTRAAVPESLNGLSGPAWDFGGLLVIDGGESPYAGWNFILAATAPTVQGVSVVGLGDLAAGDPVSDFASVFGSDPNYIEGYGTYGLISVPPYSWTSANVTFFAAGTSTVFTMIIAPTGA